MTVEQQAEKLIDEAYEYAPSSGGTKEAISIRIAIWCAEKIASNIGFSPNDEYWADVIKYLKKKLCTVLADEVCFHSTQDRVRTHRGYHCNNCGKRF